MSFYKNDRCGIYKISFIGERDVYIGSSAVLRSRRAYHLRSLERGVHPNNRLQTMYNINKNIRFSILEYCEYDELVEKEQFYMDCFRSTLNINRVAIAKPKKPIYI